VVTLDTILMTTPYGVRLVPPRGYRLGEGRGISFFDDVLLGDGETRTLTFRPQRTGRGQLQVRVLDDADQPVRQVRVTLYTATAIERELFTGADGQATIGDVITEGEYGVRVLAPPGYSIADGRGQSFVDGVRLSDGETRALVFRARRVP
jgi:hypothetical protein